MTKRFEDVIAEQGRLVYTSEGNSMYPIIREGDLLIIEAVSSPLKVGDVPLYRRGSGQYVLHRIVGIRKGRYSTRGDNRAFVEDGITADQIIGVLTGIVRGGKTYPAETLAERNARIARDVIWLAACAVNEETPDRERVEGMDLAEVYRVSAEHMLTAAVSFALEKAVELPRDFDQAKKKAIRRLALFEVERAAVTRELERAGIWYLPLKGILLKDHYPRSAMREMTDNDILVDGSRMEDVRRIMEGLGYTYVSYGAEHHDVYSKPPVLEFEMHRSLFSDGDDPVLAAYYADIQGRLLRRGCECSLSDEDLYLYLVSHAYNHHTHGGTGLRSLLDEYVFLRAHPGLDRSYIDAELSRLRISGFEERLRRLSGKVFTGAELDEQERKELDAFVTSGYKGTFENLEYRRISDSLGGDDSAASKRRYILRRFFISGEALERNYPFVAKHRALYPLLLVYRPIKGALTHPQGIITELKKILRFKKKKEL